jgi:hypothetical protein
LALEEGLLGLIFLRGVLDLLEFESPPWFFLHSFCWGKNEKDAQENRR